MNHEAYILDTLREASIHKVLSQALAQFVSEHKCHPELIFLSSKCRMQFVVELINQNGFTPDEAVVEPVWLQLASGKAIPLLYSPNLGEDYVRLLNRSILASIVL
jgi:hypothetical protein